MLITIALVAAALRTGQTLAPAFFNICFSFSAKATTTKGCVRAALLAELSYAKNMCHSP